MDAWHFKICKRYVFHPSWWSYYEYDFLLKLSTSTLYSSDFYFLAYIRPFIPKKSCAFFFLVCMRPSILRVWISMCVNVFEAHLGLGLLKSNTLSKITSRCSKHYVAGGYHQLSIVKKSYHEINVGRWVNDEQ